MLDRLWSFPIGRASAGTPFWLTWNAVALGGIMLVPLRSAGASPLWTAPPPDFAFALLLGSTFLAFALFLAVASSRDGGVRLPVAMFGGVVCYAVAFVILLLRPDIRSTSLPCVVAALAGPPLALCPYLFRTYRMAAVAALTLLVFVGSAATPRARATNTRERRVIASAIKVIAFTYKSGLVPPSPRDGGAIEQFGNSLLLVTGDGTFYILTPSADVAALTSRRLFLVPPVTAEQFRDMQQSTKNAARLRVTDIVLTPEEPRRVFVAHQFWNTTGKCFTMRVSVAYLNRNVLERTAPPPSGAATDWTTFFESSPCLPPVKEFDDIETGGRLAWLGKELLLTIGDHGFDGRGTPAMSQSDDNDYGKVLLLDSAGRAQVFTKGHRNPQGLLVSDQQHVWETEHGPQGGDELNLLERGRNYGWPMATYGADYGLRFWPLAPTTHNHGNFAEPLHAFVPSIGISNLIQVGSRQFPEWRGDLLVASLRPQMLYRVRLRADRVTYVEPISTRREVRDLVEGLDGRIYLWTDEHDVVVLSPGTSVPAGGLVYETCRACHEPTSSARAVAPSLRGVVGRQVAGDARYTYSPAMMGLGGRWTEDRLDAFLANPNGYAPGTAMSIGGIAAPAERKALVEFLKSYR